MQRYGNERTPKWWKPENEEQKVLFEDIKKDVLSAFIVNKEGVLMGSILGFLRDMIGQEMPLREMGFGSVGEFFFHLDDLFEVRRFDQRRFPMVSFKKFLFVKESAISEKTLHLRNLVSGQHSAKRRGADPTPNYKNTVPCSSEELLRFGYRPPLPQPLFSVNTGHGLLGPYPGLPVFNRPYNYNMQQPSSLVSREREPVYPTTGRKIPLLEFRYEQPAAPTINFSSLDVPRASAGRVCRMSAALERELGLDDDNEYAKNDFDDDFDSSEDEVDFAVIKKDEKQNNFVAATTSKENNPPSPSPTPPIVYNNSVTVTANNDANIPTPTAHIKSIITTTVEVNTSKTVPTTCKPENISTLVNKNATSTTGAENIPALVYKNSAATANNDANIPTTPTIHKKSIISTTVEVNTSKTAQTTSKPENISTLVNKKATSITGAENIPALVYKNAVPSAPAAIVEMTKIAQVEIPTVTDDNCVNKIEYSLPEANHQYFDPAHEIEFVNLECGSWVFEIGQYNNSLDFMVVNYDANSKKMVNDLTTEMTGWYNITRRNGKLQTVDNILDKGIYCGFCEESKTWCRVQVDISNKLDNGDVTAFFCDFGKLRQISCQNLSYLKEKYCKLPRQAFFAETDFSKNDSKYSESGRLTLERLFGKSEEMVFKVEIQNISLDASIIPFLTLSITERIS